MKKETTLSQDVKTTFIGGCKALVSWIQTFGQPKVDYTKKALDKEMKMMYTKQKPP